MYLGSVRFFKHLIYLTMLSLVLLVGSKVYHLGVHLIAAPTTEQSAYGQLAVASAGLGMAASERLLDMPQPQVETAEMGAGPGRSNAAAPVAETGVVKVLDEDSPASLEVEQEDAPRPAVELLEYQQVYPDLYAALPTQFRVDEKAVYLTFDDGPSERTLEILDILKEQDIPATFFVVTTNCDPAILKRIVAEGHTIGIHSHSHNYRQIYASVEAFLDDFYQAYQTIYDATAVAPRVLRFPGGSINAYNMGNHQQLIAEMLRRGFVYYDWNLTLEDSIQNRTAEMMVDDIKAAVRGQNRLILLAHDSRDKYETVKALPDIIEFLQEEGYTFAALDQEVQPIMFAYARFSN